MEHSYCNIMRKKLTAPITYFVRTDGNNANDGLANTPASAFLTIQAAVNVILRDLDTRGYDTTIQVADGVYSSGAVIQSPVQGGGIVSIIGNVTTPTNVVINTATGSNAITSYYHPTPIQVSGFKLNSPNAYGLLAAQNARIQFSAINFGFSGTGGHILATNSSIIQATGNYTVSGNASRHVDAQFISTVRVPSLTVTVSGTPAFSANFADAYHISCVDYTGTTITGAATGQRYNATANSLIRTGAGNAAAAYFPGSLAGSANNGSVYQ